MVFTKGHKMNLGIVSWSKNLTKEIDERVKKRAENLKNYYKKNKNPTCGFQKGAPNANKGKKLSEFIPKESNERRKKNISKTITGHITTKGTKKKQSTSHKNLWKNPEYAKKKFEIDFQIRPTIPEKTMMNIIKENNLPFNYVGDGSFWLRGENHSFNPDFLSKNPKHIIEVFGDYWHTLPQNQERDKERLKTYTKYGYKTLVVWEHELKNPIQVIEKINKFMEVK